MLASRRLPGLLPALRSIPARTNSLRATPARTRSLMTRKPAAGAFSSLHVPNQGSANVLLFSTDSVRQDKDKEDAPEKLGPFRSMFRKYGYVFVVTYGSVYVCTLTGLYLAVASGGFTAADIGDSSDGISALDKLIQWLDFVNFPVDYIEIIKHNPKAGNFALAWLTTKLVEPLRLAFSMGVTPSIARRLGRA
eukprot:TRINITY_DN2367_c0_g1_i2.p1 TRINITY_DN2367_c0_g1~~TRINITY_DN2367_c0_g1_i2.p1  ORF type:complete len:193 (-),score=30.50 TRINITY_DN2367_c0_g1_i2:325-903(-)